MPITFHKEEIEFDLPDEKRIIDWLTSIAKNEEKTLSQLTYIFCSDEYLLNINKSYLNHDYYTDIITFPYKQGAEIESDIFISIDRIKDHAKEYNVSFQEELMRVIAHGLLHMMGYGDKSEEEQEVMTEMENACLAQWSF